MSKRTAKKRIGAAVAVAIDHVMGMDIADDQLENRVNNLFNIYEDAMTRVNKSSAVKGRTAVKKHFAALYGDVQQAVTSAIKG